MSDFYVESPFDDVEEEFTFWMYPNRIFNEFIDRKKLSYLEYVTLEFLMRVTLGFISDDGLGRQKKRRLTIEHFINGIKKRDGTVIVSGLGSSQRAMRRAIEKLKDLGLIIRIIDDRDLGRIKIDYQLRKKRDNSFYFNGKFISDFYYYPEAHSNKEQPRLSCDFIRGNCDNLVDPRVKITHFRDDGQTTSDGPNDTPRPDGAVRGRWSGRQVVRMKDTPRKKDFVATLRCDDVCEDSSQPEEKPKPKKQPSDFDKSASEQLRKIVEETTGIKNERQSKSWPNNFRLLREIDKIEETKIQEILNWYQIVSPLKEKYTPVVRCGKTFREKFQKLNDALERWTRDNPKQIKKIKPKRVVVPLRPIRPREISIPKICFEKKSPFFRSYYQFLCERDMDRYFGRDDKTLKKELKNHQREFRKFLKERIDRSKLTLEEVKAAGLEFLIIDKKDPASAS